MALYHVNASVITKGKSPGGGSRSAGAWCRGGYCRCRRPRWWSRRKGGSDARDALVCRNDVVGVGSYRGHDPGAIGRLLARGLAQETSGTFGEGEVME
jgi:hypothetical protein